MACVPFARFEREILDLYDATRSRGTWTKMRQALRELREAGARSTRDLTPLTVARFVRQSRTRPGRSDISSDSLLRSVSAACSYAARMGYVRTSPFTVVQDWGLDREPDDVPRHLTLGELGRLLRHLESGKDTWRGGRLLALVATLAYTGVRRGEALHLMARDVDLDRLFLRIPRRRLRHKAKTKASAALVPMAPALAPILKEWLGRAGSPWVFPGVAKAGPWTGGPLGKRPREEIRDAAAEVGIKGANFLVFRHSFATHAPRWGIDNIRLKQVLRHTNLRTQDRYIHPDADGLRDAVSRVSFG